MPSPIPPYNGSVPLLHLPGATSGPITADALFGAASLDGETVSASSLWNELAALSLRLRFGKSALAQAVSLYATDERGLTKRQLQTLLDDQTLQFHAGSASLHFDGVQRPDAGSDLVHRNLAESLFLGQGSPGTLGLAGLSEALEDYSALRASQAELARVIELYGTSGRLAREQLAAALAEGALAVDDGYVFADLQCEGALWRAADRTHACSFAGQFRRALVDSGLDVEFSSAQLGVVFGLLDIDEDDRNRRLPPGLLVIDDGVARLSHKAVAMALQALKGADDAHGRVARNACHLHAALRQWMQMGHGTGGVQASHRQLQAVLEAVGNTVDAQELEALLDAQVLFVDRSGDLDVNTGLLEDVRDGDAPSDRRREVDAFVAGLFEGADYRGQLRYDKVPPLDGFAAGVAELGLENQLSKAQYDLVCDHYGVIGNNDTLTEAQLRRAVADGVIRIEDGTVDFVVTHEIVHTVADAVWYLSGSDDAVLSPDDLVRGLRRAGFALEREEAALLGEVASVDQLARMLGDGRLLLQGHAAHVDMLRTPQDTALTIDVFDHDDGEMSLSAPHARHGRVEVDDEGRLRYTPDPGFTGTDLIAYTVDDGWGLPYEAQLTVAVAAAPKTDLAAIAAVVAQVADAQQGAIDDAVAGGADWIALALTVDADGGLRDAGGHPVLPSALVQRMVDASAQAGRPLGLRLQLPPGEAGAVVAAALLQAMEGHESLPVAMESDDESVLRFVQDRQQRADGPLAGRAYAVPADAGLSANDLQRHAAFCDTLVLPGERLSAELVAAAHRAGLEVTAAEPMTTGTGLVRTRALLQACLRYAGMGVDALAGTEPRAADAVRDATAHPLNVGHRGDPDAKGDHTREGYLSAMAHGADYIEPDLVLTQDGEIVSMHDATVGGEAVSGMTLAELRARRPNVMTFGEILSLVATYNDEHGTGIGVMPELKVGGVAMVDAFVQALQDASTADQRWTQANSHVIVQSSDLATLQLLRGRVPHLLDYLANDHAAGNDRYEKLAQARGVADIISTYRYHLDEAFVRQAHEDGVLVVPYTYKHAGDRHEHFSDDDIARQVLESLAWGVDGVFSNAPAVSADATRLMEHGAATVMADAGAGDQVMDAGIDHLALMDGTADPAQRVTVEGNARDNIVFGHAGENVLEGRAGNDRLHGLQGDDTLIGGAGDDFLAGGLGNDRLDGGAGDDVIEFGRGDGQDVLASAASIDGHDTLRLKAGIEPDDLVFEVDEAGSLVIGIQGADDTFTVEGFMPPAGSAAAARTLQIEFYDGGAGLTDAQLRERLNDAR